MSHQMAAVTLNMRYRLLHQLGAGGMGIVYRAVDRLTGKFIAVKRVLTSAANLLPTASLSNSTDIRLALAQEFQILASLRHPHIIGVLDYGFDADKQPYFTMDLLDQPQTIVEAGQGEPWQSKVDLLVQVLQALSYLHKRGVVHRDLKPGNILVAEGQIKVVDFGLSVNTGQETNPAGTLAYMAPEILEGHPANITTDLYAVGVIAYELFVGHHPFQATTMSRLMEDILHTIPDVHSGKIDPSLVPILERLLSKSPQGRYSSAQEVIEALSAAIGQFLPLETQATRESLLQTAKLIGRDDELQMLLDLLASVTQGCGKSCLVGGESGVGKSRLLNELSIRAVVNGAIILRGQAISEGGQPYQLWKEPLRWLALLDMSPLEASVIKAVIPDIADLVDYAVEDAPVLDAKSAQTRLLSTLVDVLRRNRQPLVILLEDLQWADSESLTLLSWINRAVNELPIFILGNYRNDEHVDLPATFPEMQLLTLQRLEEREIAELSQTMLGASGGQRQVIDLLVRETEGNVFFLIEVLRALGEEAGQLDKVGFMTLPDHVFVGGIQRIVQRRLSRIPTTDQALLQVAAVAGRWLDLAVLKAAEPERNLERWLTNASNAAVLDVQEDRWRFAHDKLREGVMNPLNADQLADLHRTVAQAIEAAYPDVEKHAVALTYHWAMAHNDAKEAHYAQLAGEQAAARYASADALRYLERALALTTDLQARIPILLKLSEVLEFTGKFAEAEKHCREVISLLETLAEPYWLACAQKLLGYLLWAKAIFVEAIEWLERSRAGFEALNKEQEMANALADMGMAYHDLGDYAHALPCYERSLQIAKVYNDWKSQGTITRRIGNIHLLHANYPLALSYYEQALQVAEQIGDKVGASGAFGNIGIVHFYQGDYSKSLEFNRKHLQIAIELGQKRGICLNFHNASTIYLEQGEYEPALACAGQYLRLSVEIDNRVGFMVAPKAIADIFAAQGKDADAERLYQLSIKVGRILNSPYYLSDSLFACAELYDRQGHYMQAKIYNDEALKLSTETNSKEVQFVAETLSIRLRFQLHEISQEEATNAWTAMMQTWSELLQQAALHYEIWRLTRSNEHGSTAGEIYKTTYAKTPSIKYRKRYAEITGTLLPLPTALPAPHEMTTQFLVDLETLLSRIQEIISG